MTSLPASENLRIAARLREAGARLEEQGANAFAATAFQRAADTVERWPRRCARSTSGAARLDCESSPAWVAELPARSSRCC
jgi:hypothetical protein